MTPGIAAPLQWEAWLPLVPLEAAILDYRRAVYLQGLSTLLVSDLHWGKSETFQQHGIPVPQSVLIGDLARLSALIAQYQPHQVLVLGDLIHGRPGLTPTLIDTIAAWRAEHPLPLVLVAGNHDRAIQTVAERWQISVIAGTLTLENFVFSHAPAPQPGKFNWCGHIHPTVRLITPTDKLRLPCFHLQARQGVLPAFSQFTGGFNIHRTPGDQVFAIGDDFVMRV